MDYVNRFICGKRYDKQFDKNPVFFASFGFRQMKPDFKTMNCAKRKKKE